MHRSQGSSAAAAAAAAFLPHAPVLVPTVLNAVDDQFYKIASEALLVLETLVRVLRPVGAEGQIEKGGKWTEYVQKIYHCCFSRLKASDIDQVRSRLESFMGQSQQKDLLSG